MNELQEQALAVANRHIIERPRLTRLLDETTARVILLVAPAGYGKTTLARQWLSEKRHVWYRPSANAEIAAVAVGVVGAVRGVAADVGDDLRRSLSGRRSPIDVDGAEQLVTRDLARVSEPLWLALDDYHELSEDAQELIRRLRAIEPLRLVLTTRHRPTWRSSRDIVYGEVLELGQETLAMTRAEAEEVLETSGGEAATFIDVAGGWPAVIGLASFAKQVPNLTGPTLPPELHDYIAEELFATLAPSSRSGLARLSLFETLSPARVEAFLKSDGDYVLAEGRRVGFVPELSAGCFRIHPLLRQFLLQKFRQLPENTVVIDLRRAVDILLGTHEWANVLEIIQSFNANDLFDDLIRASLYELLDESLLSFATNIVETTRASNYSSALTTLLEAELAFREGLHDQSSHLAETAGAELLNEPSFAAKAFLRAGQSSYFGDALEESLSYFTRARELAVERTDQRDAQWGLFLTAVEREDRGATQLLTEFERLCGSSADDRLRIQNGRLHYGMRIGSVYAGLSGSRSVARLASSAQDPTIRVSFWHVYSGALRLAAQYSDALTASDAAFEQATASSLTFAIAHVHLTRATIHLGLANCDDALDLLRNVESLATATDDPYLQMNERVSRCRAHLLNKNFESAADAIDTDFAQPASSGQYSEFLAMKALIVGMAGETDRALHLLDDAESASRENEALASRAAVRALLSLNGSATEDPEVTSVLQECVAKGVLDPWIFAFRLEPRLVRLADSKPATRRTVRQALARLSDRRRRGSGGVPYVFGIESLTPRERDILALLVDGKTNREIANVLFVEETTAKAHVRNVLRKLGVRTRTEAAVLALKMQGPRSS